MRARLGTVLAMATAAALGGAAEEAGPDLLVTARPGTLPIVLTAPHGGSARIPGVPERTEGVRLQDTLTLEVTEAVAARLEALAGARPHVVLARFHRRYLDANRAPAEALMDPRARPSYDAYHQAVRAAVAAARRNPRGGLLVDLHGQAADPETVHRGTRDGQTVRRLLAEQGPTALTGPDSLFGGLAAAGFTVFPGNTPPGEPAEARSFRGGHTVATYGSHHEDGLDAVQVEIGAALRRDPARRAALAEALAASLHRFHTRYLAR